MRKRPNALLFFSIFMLSVAMSIPIQISYLQDFENIFQMITMLNIFLIIVCALTSVAAYNLHKSFHYLLFLAILSVLLNNWWVGFVGLDFNLFETSVASLGFLFCCSVLLEKKTYQVLRNPKLKWWDTSLRSKIEIPVALSPALRGPALIKKSYDISETGVFIQGLNQDEFERLKIGEKFSICFYFHKILKIRCDAMIVRKSKESGSYPAGVGLKFVGIDEKIKSVIRRLSEIKNYA